MNKKPVIGGIILVAIVIAIVFGAQINPDNPENAETNNIEWVRIHNLPDHVYFNHSQHVVAGNVECQTCHGPVE